MVVGDGFEPSNSERADLQSAVILLSSDRDLSGSIHIYYNNKAV